jgi:hypothetical protein
MKYKLVNNNVETMDSINESIIPLIMTFIVGILIGGLVGYFILRDIKYIGPDSNEIVKHTYTDSEGKQYKYKPNITVCPINYSMSKLHDTTFKEFH